MHEARKRTVNAGSVGDAGRGSGASAESSIRRIGSPLADIDIAASHYVPIDRTPPEVVVGGHQPGFLRTSCGELKFVCSHTVAAAERDGSRQLDLVVPNNRAVLCCRAMVATASASATLTTWDFSPIRSLRNMNEDRLGPRPSPAQKQTWQRHHRRRRSAPAKGHDTAGADGGAGNRRLCHRQALAATRRTWPIPGRGHRQHRRQPG